MNCEREKTFDFLVYNLQGTRLVYKHLATLYFVFVFDSSENELAMLDLVQGNLTPSHGIVSFITMTMHQE